MLAAKQLARLFVSQHRKIVGFKVPQFFSVITNKRNI
jgi:hypothetical protein